jgi:hypothetical protein
MDHILCCRPAINRDVRGVKILSRQSRITRRPKATRRGCRKGLSLMGNKSWSTPLCARIDLPGAELFA